MLRLYESEPRPSENGHDAKRPSAVVDSYHRLADVFHHVLSEQSLDTLLERIADTLAELVPYDTITIYRADEEKQKLRPVLARDRWEVEILNNVCSFGEGLTGWAAEHRIPLNVPQIHLDPRACHIPGTPEDEPEALVSVPLYARGSIKGALNLYRLGQEASFSEEEFELAVRFGDAAALAIDNAEGRERLERQAQSDALTGLLNHRAFHERLRAELGRASRSREPVAVLMLDVDDFKRTNDIYGHATGDHVLVRLSELLTATVRLSDVVCRVGGEEFAVVMAGCNVERAFALARRIERALDGTTFDPAGRLTVSIGVAEAPRHAMNPRDLAACAELAMMTAKARGAGEIVLFDPDDVERPGPGTNGLRDARSIAHLKLLQSLVGRLNRLNDVREIGATIVSELRTLIDYHNGRVYLAEGDNLVPIAFRGDLGAYGEESEEVLASTIGEGITGRVAATGKSALIDNALLCDYAVQVPGTPEIEESIVAVPLVYGSAVIGVIVISKLGVGQFDEDDVRLLEVLAGHASVALENARLYEAARLEAEHARESAEIASALLGFSRSISTADGLESVLLRIVERAASAAGAATASVWLQREPGTELTLGAEWVQEPLQRRALESPRFPPHVAEELAGAREPFLVEAAAFGRDDAPPEAASQAYAVAPLRLDADRLGCLVVAIENGSEELSEPMARLLAGLADQSKLAIGNATNYETLERTFLSTVEALANALEANDEYTSHHARSLKNMALRVGGALGLDGPALKRLELGALFHDIGKIGIPSEILRKPGPLDEAERALVEQHPKLGERILRPIERLSDVRPVIRHCHECWDGSGYPDGLAHDEIPIESRIIFVCDAYHAMTTDRPYRARVPAEEARAQLRDAAGTQFDPRVVEAFLSLV
jgi:diguanylate cyclase (GGDEF)-like protein